MAALPQRSNRKPDDPETIRAWLASAHPSPSQSRREWTTQHIALLPLGRRFGAVRIPGVLVHAAAGSDSPHTVAATIARELRGPVIHDRLTVGPTYYALVPWWPHIHWEGANDTPYLGPGVFLGVPDIGRTEPPGSYWVTQPRHRFHLCRREDVFDFIVRARCELRKIREAAPDSEVESVR
ncbi:hypothetical protein [Streptomyces sp. NPDC093984]|uniref:hypothetical protein n=1 Tax=Streptomyces sp. NPDC093984 TaxID=3366052 RepID=UPI0038301F74